MKTRTLLLILFSLLFATAAHAQIVSEDQRFDEFGRDTTRKAPEQGKLEDFYKNKDSVKKFYAKDMRYTVLSQLDRDTITYLRIDTGLTNLQNYHPWYRNGDYHYSLGNYGLAAQSIFPAFDSKPGFKNGQKALSLFEFKPEERKLYRVYSPFSEIIWNSAFGKESVIDFYHTQNIKPNLNIGLEYSSYGSEGYYPRQQVRANLISLWTWYQSKNQRYNIVGTLTDNGMKAPESGGLTSDTLFTKDTGREHLFESVYLNNAETKWHSSTFMLTQSYVIGQADSTARYQSKAFKSPFSRIINTTRYDTRRYGFNYDYSGSRNPDPKTAEEYFGQTFVNTESARDQIEEKRFRTDFDATLYGRGGSERFNIGGGVAYENLSYSQSIFDTREIEKQLNNIFLKGRIGMSVASNIELDLRGQLGMAGYNNGDLQLRGDASVNMGQRIGKVFLHALLQREEPAIIFQEYSSNFHKWDNRFSKMTTTQLGFTYANGATRTRLGGEYQLVDNYLYFSRPQKEVLPQQAGKILSLLRIKAEQEVHFGKFVWASEYVYQANNSKDILPTPDFYTYQSLYLSHKLLKVLDFQLGMDIRYYTKLTAYGYAPELGQFFVQDGNVTVGNYPIADLFFNAGMKRTRVTFKWEYLNQQLGKNGYYTVQNYGMPDRTIKIGLSWRFYD